MNHRYHLFFFKVALALIIQIGVIQIGHANSILFFNQDCNVDLAGADNTCDDERSNLLSLLQQPGNAITLLSSFNDPALTGLLASNDALYIPDIEDAFGDCDVNNPLFIGAAAKMAIASFVSGGGDVVIAGSTQNITFVNAVFGLGLVSTGNTSTSSATKNTAQSQGTPFESCPDQLANLSVTFLVSSSMPSNKRCIYEQADGSASVAYFPIGTGGVVYLGYDFNDGGIGCSQEGSIWVSCILGATDTVVDNGILLPTIPTLSEWFVLILGLLFVILGVTVIRNKQLQLS